MGVVDWSLYAQEDCARDAVMANARNFAQPLVEIVARPRCRFDVLRTFDPGDHFDYWQQVSVVGEQDRDVAPSSQDISAMATAI